LNESEGLDAFDGGKELIPSALISGIVKSQRFFLLKQPSTKPKLSPHPICCAIYNLDNKKASYFIYEAKN
jgi:hypothetical protein